MKHLLMILLASLTLLWGCTKDETAEEEKKPWSEDVKPASEGSEEEGEVVATVNGKGIPAARLNVYAQPGQNPLEVINNIIASELIEQAARKLNLHEEDVITQQLKVAEQTVLGRAYTQKFIAENPVSDELIEERYKEFKTEYDGRAEYRASHILVEDKELADKIQSDVAVDGEKFAELAREHSQDPGSAANGGDLGWADPRDFVPEFGTAITLTEPGSLAEAPVQTQFGWHVIRVEEKRVLPIPDLNAEMRQSIQQSEHARMFSDHIKVLREQADIQIKIPTP